MTAEGIFGVLASAIKFPLFRGFKLILNFLNLIPTTISDIHGIRGFGVDDRPDLREYHTVIRGHRRLHFGRVFIAFLKGAIVRCHQNSQDTDGLLGVYAEDIHAITAKWTYSSVDSYTG